jgi:hypothetical protein
VKVVLFASFYSISLEMIGKAFFFPNFCDAIGEGGDDAKNFAISPSSIQCLAVAARNNFNWYGRFLGIFFKCSKLVGVFVPYLFIIIFNNNSMYDQNIFFFS